MRRSDLSQPPPAEVGPARLGPVDIVTEPSQPRGSAGGRSAAQRPGGGDSAAAYAATPHHPGPDHLRWQGNALHPPPPGEGEERLRQALFSPRSVALIGQSNDPGKTAGRPLKFLRQAGFAGRIYPVNARRAEVLGERAWPAVEALPEGPQHAYVVAPIDAARAATEASGRAGVAAATRLTGAFAEVGEAGRARETRLREIVASTGMRIVRASS